MSSFPSGGRAEQGSIWKGRSCRESSCLCTRTRSPDPERPEDSRPMCCPRLGLSMSVAWPPSRTATPGWSAPEVQGREGDELDLDSGRAPKPRVSDLVRALGRTHPRRDEPRPHRPGPRRAAGSACGAHQCPHAVGSRGDGISDQSSGRGATQNAGVSSGRGSRDRSRDPPVLRAVPAGLNSGIGGPRALRQDGGRRHGDG